jgi:Bacterial low temperature requirement A protein (LtrA)
MAGVLVLAAGVPAARNRGDFGAATLGYAIMRLGLVAQWLRAAIEDPSSRGTALRFAVGITIALLEWMLPLSAGGWLSLFAALVLLEPVIPLWAERKMPTSWHPHHIPERYGLFAIILLGESVFAASTGVERALAAGGERAPLVIVAASALALVFALRPPGRGVAGRGRLRDRDPGRRVPGSAVGATRSARGPAGVRAHGHGGWQPRDPAARAGGAHDCAGGRRRGDLRHLRVDRRDNDRERVRAPSARSRCPSQPGTGCAIAPRSSFRELTPSLV